MKFRTARSFDIGIYYSLTHIDIGITIPQVGVPDPTPYNATLHGSDPPLPPLLRSAATRPKSGASAYGVGLDNHAVRPVQGGF
eukprot:COSAG06_NODE_13511_length_1250_cov_1.488271_2_plen_83_part_00